MLLAAYLKEAFPDLRPCQADTAFAKLVGTTRQTIYRLRRFERGPSLQMMMKISEASRGLVNAEDHVRPVGYHN